MFGPQNLHTSTHSYEMSHARSRRKWSYNKYITGLFGHPFLAKAVLLQPSSISTTEVLSKLHAQVDKNLHAYDKRDGFRRFIQRLTLTLHLAARNTRYKAVAQIYNSSFLMQLLLWCWKIFRKQLSIRSQLYGNLGPAGQTNRTQFYRLT